MGMSITQGGSGIPFLAKEVYSYIVTGEYTQCTVDVNDIPEGILKFVVQSVS